MPEQSKKLECAPKCLKPKSPPRPRPVPPVLIDPNQRYSMAETASILRQSRAKTYVDIRDGRLQVVKDGARTYAHGTELIRRSAQAD